ncbi:DUF1707 domain-containing protein [Actinocatenispora sera]|uniref:Cell wall-active antibiotic response 4TMS protein YvqF n=1 Tax=Actinocatenispora sera TaxID=390989 RepID=A0A810KXU2_9ACTN|nr:DUF1707 domain-containing protein [Actinocatenispora sera]BCJ27252.1 hypothetical protein Asera_13600 [Actinocatenispora sera]
MQPEPLRPVPPPPLTDADREAAVELLQRACGEGRLTLEEFGVRAGAAWAADTSEELAEVTAGLAAAPPVGTSQPVTVISAVFGEHKQYGRWRVSRHTRVRALFGSTKLDLREATMDAEVVRDGVVDIEVRTFCGEVKITVPEGVEVEVYGRSLFGSRTTNLAAVPRRQGTPTIRLHCNVTFGEMKVRSAPLSRHGGLLGNGKLGRILRELVD